MSRSPQHRLADFDASQSDTSEAANTESDEVPDDYSSPVLNPRDPSLGAVREARSVCDNWKDAFDLDTYWQSGDLARSAHLNCIDAIPEMVVDSDASGYHRLEDVELMSHPFPDLWITTEIGDKISISASEHLPPDTDSEHPETVTPYVEPRIVNIRFNPVEGDIINVHSAKMRFDTGVLLGFGLSNALTTFRREYSEREFQYRSRMLLYGIYGHELFLAEQSGKNPNTGLIGSFKSTSFAEKAPTPDYVGDGVRSCLRAALIEHPSFEYDATSSVPSTSLPAAYNPDHDDFQPIPPEYNIITNDAHEVSKVTFTNPETGETSTLVTRDRYESARVNV